MKSYMESLEGIYKDKDHKRLNDIIQRLSVDKISASELLELEVKIISFSSVISCAFRERSLYVDLIFENGELLSYKAPTDLTKEATEFMFDMVKHEVNFAMDIHNNPEKFLKVEAVRTSIKKVIDSSIDK